MEQQKSTGRSLQQAFSEFLHERFDLRDDQAYEGQTLESVRRDVQFKGANLWILLFAILICSIGLNVNSPAVVIGAMLISPLMGPILGIGVSVAIYDFDLLVTAFKNLAIATVASVIVSAAYFSLSPITEAQSELMARVSPTLWDVLIASFGGFAGIIAVSRKEKGNALPGVAIATALMPPICTAGYAIATAQWNFFAGSLYLFFINIVFIAVSTFILARWMRFSKHQFVDAARESRVRRWILAIVLVVAIPSVYTAYTTVQKSLYLQRAQRFVEQECNYADAEIIQRKITPGIGTAPGEIELLLLGRNVSDEEINASIDRLEQYRLEGTQLNIMQDSDDNRESDVAIERALLEKESAISQLYKRNEATVREKEQEIASLEEKLAAVTKHEVDLTALNSEAKILFPQLEEISFGQLKKSANTDTTNRKSVGIAYLNVSKALNRSDQRKLSAWIASRSIVDTVLIVQ